MGRGVISLLTMLAASGCMVNPGEGKTDAASPTSAVTSADATAPAPAIAHATTANLTSTSADSSASAASSTAHHAKDEIAVPAVDPVRAVESSPAMGTVRTVTVPAGTALALEMISGISSAVSHVEDRVQATVQSPITVNGIVVVPAGSTVSGYVTEATRSARVKGRARLGVRFNALHVNGTRYDIRTAAITREAPGTKKEDAKKIAIGAGAGAIVGAMAGGKKGAAIGSTVGAGGGTAAVLATRGDEVALPRGARVSARLASPVTLRIH